MAQWRKSPTCGFGKSEICPTVVQVPNLCFMANQRFARSSASLRLVLICFMANQRFTQQWRKSPTCTDMKINFVTGLLALFTLSASVPVPHLLYHSFFILRGKPLSWILCGFIVPFMVLFFYRREFTKPAQRSPRGICTLSLA